MNSDRWLHTSIYCKDFVKNTVLHANSFHPDHLLDKIPYGQFIILRRICSDEQDYVSKAKEMAERSRRRGYNQSAIYKAMKRANQKEKSILLNPQSTQCNNEKRITFVSEYSSASWQIKSIINKHWKVVECDPNLNHLSSSRSCFCFKIGRNIRDMVVSSVYQQPILSSWLSQQIFGNYSCGSKNLLTVCLFMSNILIWTYGLMYVGQTKHNLKLRIAEHKAVIKNNNCDKCYCQTLQRLKLRLSGLPQVYWHWKDTTQA